MGADQMGAEQMGAEQVGAEQMADEQMGTKGEALNPVESNRISAAAALGRLRGALLEAVAVNDFTVLGLLLPQYSSRLEDLVRTHAPEPSRLQRLEAEHEAFFARFQSALVTARIKVRLELERVRASRSYHDEPTKEPGFVCHG